MHKICHQKHDLIDQNTSRQEVWCADIRAEKYMRMVLKSFFKSVKGLAPDVENLFCPVSIWKN